jgi:hypothetical protein
MLNVSRCVERVVYCLTPLLAAATAAAQTPAYSLAVSDVNSIVREGGPASRVAVAPGDWFTVKIFVRDWSPDGERLRSFQAALNPDGFTSGRSGSIKPVDYETTTATGVENRLHCFVDKNEPQFVHAGLETIPLADSISPGYRWASVLLNADDSPKSAQDGTRVYCGTVHLKASEDADGVFTIGFDDLASGLRQPDSAPIEPVNFENLTVEVTEAARVLRILSSDPPHGAIDARSLPPTRRGVPAGGWDTVELTLSGDAAGLKPGDLTVDDGTSDPPRVKAVSPRGRVAKIVLDRGIRPGSWTTVIHKASRTNARFGCLPGDVDNDGVTGGRDVLALLHDRAGERALAGYRGDINRDGIIGVADALKIIDVLTDPAACRKTLRPQPTR